MKLEYKVTSKLMTCVDCRQSAGAAPSRESGPGEEDLCRRPQGDDRSGDSHRVLYAVRQGGSRRSHRGSSNKAVERVRLRNF